MKVFVTGGGGVVLRFAQLQGPGSSHITTSSARARRRTNPSIRPPGDCTSFFLDEAAGAAVAATPQVPACIYDVADDELRTRAEAGWVLAEALGIDPPHAVPAAPLALVPPLAEELMEPLRIADARLEQASGWRPTRPSIQGSWWTATGEAART